MDKDKQREIVKSEKEKAKEKNENMTKEERGKKAKILNVRNIEEEKLDSQRLRQIKRNGDNTYIYGEIEKQNMVFRKRREIKKDI